MLPVARSAKGYVKVVAEIPKTMRTTVAITSKKERLRDTGDGRHKRR